MTAERPNIENLPPMISNLVRRSLALGQTDVATELIGNWLRVTKAEPQAPFGSPQDVPSAKNPEVMKRHIKRDGRR